MTPFRICSILIVVLAVVIMSLEARTVSDDLQDPKQTFKISNGKYVQDPFMFYRWPGFAQTQGLDGRYYPHPVIVVPEKSLKTIEDEEKEKQALQDDEDEAEDDEEDWEEDDEPYYQHPPQPHYKPWKKQQPVGVSSFGISPPTNEKATWWGVLNTRARNGLIEIEDEENFDDDDGTDDNGSVENLPVMTKYRAFPKKIVQRWLYRAPSGPYQLTGHEAEGNPWVVGY